MSADRPGVIGVFVPIAELDEIIRFVGKGHTDLAITRLRLVRRLRRKLGHVQTDIKS